MSAVMFWLVGAGGAAGAVARHAVSIWMSKRKAPPHMATLLVNLSGSFAAGWLLGMSCPSEHPEGFALAGTGFLGGFTTYSALNAQKAAMARQGDRRTLVRYAAVTYIGAGALTVLGWLLGLQR